MPRRHMPRHSICWRSIPELCCVMEIQASRLLFCRTFLYIQQFMSLVFCAYPGAGTQSFSLWTSLFTALGGVILGTETSRVLNLHVFYSTRTTSEDLHFIDLKHQQRLLSRLRLGLLLCGLSNLVLAFARAINYYSMNTVSSDQNESPSGLSNFTTWFQKSTNLTSWSQLGLVDCKDDCVGVGSMDDQRLFKNCLLGCGCEDLTSETCKECFDTCTLDASSTYLKCLNDCVASHLFVSINFAFMGILQISCFILARLVVYGRI